MSTVEAKNLCDAEWECRRKALRAMRRKRRDVYTIMVGPHERRREIISQLRAVIAQLPGQYVVTPGDEADEVNITRKTLGTKDYPY